MRPSNALASIAICFVVLSVLAVGCKKSNSVVGTNPPNGATAVATSQQQIRVDFKEPMDRTSVENAFQITPAVGSEKPTFNWSNDSKTVVVNLPATLQPNTKYTVSMKPGARMYNQMAMRKESQFSFTTGPTAVAGTTAGPGSTTDSGETPPPAPAPAPSEPPKPAPLSFAKDIQPIAASTCDKCHASQATGKMSDLDNILKKKYVIPNSPDDSLYYKKGSGFVTHGGDDAWKANKSLVHDWIAQGAAK
jgi:hypothetical protein